MNSNRQKGGRMSLNVENGNDIDAVFRYHLKIEQYLRKIESLFNDRQRKRINHTPEYQRNYVWDTQKASYFIESILLGTEIPPLIFFKRGDDQMEVIDGRQRFETIARYVNNEFDLSQNGLLSMKSLAKNKYDDLPRSLINLFLDTNMRIFEFSIVGKNEVSNVQEDLIKKEIFRRYNSGITSLRKSEFEKAQHIDDPITKYFSEKLKSDLEAFKDVIRIFANPGKQISLGWFDPSLLDEIMMRVRRLVVLHEIPVRYYEREMGREAASILYDNLSRSVDPAAEYKGFMSKIRILACFQRKLSTRTPSRDRLLYEALYWSFAILENEGIEIAQLANEEVIGRYNEFILSNSKVFDSDRPYFRDVAIARREKTAHFFEEYFGLNLDEYIHNRGKISIKDLRSATPVEVGSDNVVRRLNKPDPQTITVEDLHNRMMRKQFLVRPVYQRYERITNTKASAIIESMFLGIKLPPIFVFEREDGVTEVIDGQQRILSILGFMNLTFMDEMGQQARSKREGFKLRNLRVLKELNGKTYTDLEEQLQDKLWLFTLYQVTIRQKENPFFDPVDLFVRLNYKPYPIKDNTFEMWNSFVNRRTVQMIKETSERHNSWFYLRVDNKRMENEDLITTLSYLEYQRQRKDSIGGVLDFYARGGRISSRIKSKTDITLLLETVSQDSTVSTDFHKAIKSVESFVGKTKSLLIDKDVLKDIEVWLDRELTVLFSSRQRSLNQFYILWYVLGQISRSAIVARRLDIKRRIHQLMMFVRDTNSLNEEKALRLFHEVADSIREDHTPSARKLRLKNEQISERILSQNNECPLCGNALFQGEDVEVDHIIPISLGGSDCLDNVQIVHWICNREKGNKTP